MASSLNPLMYAFLFVALLSISLLSFVTAYFLLKFSTRRAAVVYRQKLESESSLSENSDVAQYQTLEDNQTHITNSRLYELLLSDKKEEESDWEGDRGVCEKKKKKKKKRGKKKKSEVRDDEIGGEKRNGEDDDGVVLNPRSGSISKSEIKPEFVCLYPFTSTSSATQRKIKQQYDQLVKCNSAKGLTLAQVGEFANCLIEAKNELQLKRHLLTTGWSTFVSSKRLVAGDAFVFLRGENGDLRVGVRRLARHQSTMPTSVISSQSMHLGVLATASHAVSTKTLFVVFYKPRISQFIVGVNKYMEAMKHGFSLGIRFRMRFEGEESPERIFTGTIVGSGDLSSQWPASKWRSLQVQWDDTATVQRPDKVSPWEIEPVSPTSPVSTPAQQPQPKCKRSRPIELSVLTPAPPSFMYNFPQCQEPTNASSLKLFQDPSIERNNSFKAETPLPPPTPASSCYRLFGIDLPSNPPAQIPQENQPIDTSSSAKCQEPITPSSVNEQKKQQTSRTRTKVQMQGIAVGRAVDLTLLKSYEELINELEKMFEIQGQLLPRDKWIVVFTDDEGDMMLAGDDPWNEFCKMAKKIFIYSSDEVKKMTTKLKSSSSLESEDGNDY